MDRRTFLIAGVATATATAGCAAPAEPNQPTETEPEDGALVIRNQTGSDLDVEVVMRTTEGRFVLRETYAVAANGRVVTDPVVDLTGDYTTVVRVGDREQIQTVEFPRSEGTVRGYIQITVTADQITIERQTR